MQRRLLQEPELTFKKAYDIATSMESAAKNVLDIRSDSQNRPQLVQRIEQLPIHAIRHCYRCGAKNHIATSCKFKEAICRACDKKGHIARVCRSKDYHSQKSTKLSHSQPTEPPKVHNVEEVSTPALNVQSISM